MNVNTMPVAGTTSPIHLLDACIQSLAELFAGLTLLFLVNESKRRKGKARCGVVDSIRAYPFDMRYGNFVYGSAEDLLGTLYQAQMPIPWLKKRRTRWRRPWPAPVCSPTPACWRWMRSTVPSSF
jgi:trimethylamine:corrinoid methyltransferase-like protein